MKKIDNMSNDSHKLLERLLLWGKRLTGRVLILLFLAFFCIELLLLYPITRIYEIYALYNNHSDQETIWGISTLFNFPPKSLVILSIMLLFALCNSVITYLILKRLILNPLARLKMRLVNISQNGLNPEHGIPKQFPANELGDIENIYNELLKRLNDTQKIVRAHNAVLEMRVDERHKELSQIANYNLMTNLPNRNLLKTTLTQYIEKAKEDNKNIALMILVLKDFHDINNAYNQTIGTELLKQVGHKLIENMPTGTFIAHLSTSHFAIARGGLTSAHQIANLAQWILDIFHKPMIIENQNILISCTLGISIYPIDGNDAESMIANAYLALNRAPASGANSYQFYEANMNKITESRRTLLVDLHYALERNELIACYQPQVDLKTQKMIGVEALLRWKHPEKGLMPPGFFISLAEESGLIIPMGAWILKEACQQAKAWEAEGLPKLTMAVNLSSIQFKQKNIIELIQSVLLDTKLSPEQLEVEITESIIVDNIEAAIATMKTLQGIGVSISIDDFGTGYSSLSYLRRFPIQKIKIDQSFVRDIDQSVPGEEKPLADIILLLAQNLNIKTIAEGIETEAQAEYLRARGCQEGQGYLFGKPLTADAIKELLINQIPK